MSSESGVRMTDKQIIIDGVDVAKCRCFTSEWDFNNCGHICKGTECKYKRLWYKKQLKRKEQECEELIGQRDKFEFGNNILEHERNKHKQALDEIEEFCIVYSSNHDAYETVYKHILGIINKAKDSDKSYFLETEQEKDLEE